MQQLENFLGSPVYYKLWGGGIFLFPKVSVVDPEGFSQILANVFTQPSVILSAHGTATAWLGHCLMGDGLFVSGLPVDAKVKISPALNNVPGIVMLDFDSVAGTAAGLTTSFLVSVPNPTVLSVATPLLPVNLFQNHIQIGKGTILNPSLPLHSASVVHSRGVLPPGVAQVAKVIETYLEGKNQSMDAVGDPENEELQVSLLKPALKAMRNRFMMPGYKGRLMKFAKLSTDFAHLRKTQVLATILATNPWSIPFQINWMKTLIYVWNGKDYSHWIGQIGPLDFTKDPLGPIIVNPHQRDPGQWTHVMPVDIKLSECVNGHFIDCLGSLKAFFGDIKLKVEMQASCVVGEAYPIEVHFIESDMPCSFEGPSNSSSSAISEDEGRSYWAPEEGVLGDINLRAALSRPTMALTDTLEAMVVQ